MRSTSAKRRSGSVCVRARLARGFTLIELGIEVVIGNATSAKADGAPTDLTALGKACNAGPSTVVYTFVK